MSAVTFPVGVWVRVLDVFAHLPAAGYGAARLRSSSSGDAAERDADGWAPAEVDEFADEEVVRCAPLCSRNAGHGGTEAIVWTRAGWVALCTACARDELAGML